MSGSRCVLSRSDTIEVKASGPLTLMRAGLRLEPSGSQSVTADQVALLSREIESELDSVRFDYELRMTTLAEEKQAIERELQVAKERASNASFDVQVQHARLCDLASAGEAGLAVLLMLGEAGGTWNKDRVLEVLSGSFGSLDALMRLGAAGLIEMIDTSVRLTPEGHDMVNGLEALAS